MNPRARLLPAPRLGPAFLAAISLALAGLCRADSPAPAAHAATEFDTASEAAVWALHTVYVRLSPYYEYGGVVLLKPNGKYVVAVPHTDYAGDRVEIDTDPDSYPAGDMIVASYHTHPCLPKSHVPGSFSPADMKGARIERYPAYMANLCTGEVHLFDPIFDKAPPTIEIVMGAVSPGRVVGHFPVTGQSLE